MAESYSLATILAITIPLGILSLISMLFLMILTIRYSCMAARERRAYNMVRNGEFKRYSASSSLQSTGKNPAKAKGTHRSCTDTLFCIPSSYYAVSKHKTSRSSPRSGEEARYGGISPKEKSRTQNPISNPNPLSHGDPIATLRESSMKPPLKCNNGTSPENPMRNSYISRSSRYTNNIERKDNNEGYQHKDYTRYQTNHNKPRGTPGTKVNAFFTETTDDSGTHTSTNERSSHGLLHHHHKRNENLNSYTVNNYRDLGPQQKVSQALQQSSSFDPPLPPAPSFRSPKQHSALSQRQTAKNFVAPKVVTNEISLYPPNLQFENFYEMDMEKPTPPAKSVLRNKPSSTSPSTFSYERSNLTSNASNSNHQLSPGSLTNPQSKLNMNVTDLNPTPMEGVLPPQATFSSNGMNTSLSTAQSTPMATPLESLNDSGGTPAMGRINSDNIPPETQQMLGYMDGRVDRPLSFLSLTDSSKSPLGTLSAAANSLSAKQSLLETTSGNHLWSQIDSSNFTEFTGNIMPANPKDLSPQKPEASPSAYQFNDGNSRDRLLNMLLKRNESVRGGSEHIGRTEIGTTHSKMPSLTGSLVGAKQDMKPSSSIYDIDIRNQQKIDSSMLKSNIEGWSRDDDEAHWKANKDSQMFFSGTNTQDSNSPRMNVENATSQIQAGSDYSSGLQQGMPASAYKPYISTEVDTSIPISGNQNRETKAKSHEKKVTCNKSQDSNLLASPILLSQTPFTQSSRSSSLTTDSLDATESSKSLSNRAASHQGSKPEGGVQIGRVVFDETPLFSRTMRPGPLKVSRSIRDIATLREPDSPRSPGYQPGQRMPAFESIGDPVSSTFGSFTENKPGKNHIKRRSSTYAYGSHNTAVVQKSDSPKQITRNNANKRVRHIPKATRINKPLPSTPPLLEEGVVSNLGGAEYLVLLAYSPQLADELALSPGDVVKVFDVFDDGWCLAEPLKNSTTHPGKNKRGVCPCSCLSKYPVQASSS